MFPSKKSIFSCLIFLGFHKLTNPFFAFNEKQIKKSLSPSPAKESYIIENASS